MGRDDAARTGPALAAEVRLRLARHWFEALPQTDCAQTWQRETLVNSRMSMSIRRRTGIATVDDVIHSRAIA
jgi:hypothetical protein